MKKYIFTVDLNDTKQELVIHASGMVDAVNQLKTLMKSMKADRNASMKGVSYKGIIFNNHLQ